MSGDFSVFSEAKYFIPVKRRPLRSFPFWPSYLLQSYHRRRKRKLLNDLNSSNIRFLNFFIDFSVFYSQLTQKALIIYSNYAHRPCMSDFPRIVYKLYTYCSSPKNHSCTLALSIENAIFGKSVEKCLQNSLL